MFIFSSQQLLANTLKITPTLSFYSTKLVGEDESAGTDGKLISNLNTLSGLTMSYAFSQSFHLFLSYLTGSVQFDNTQDVINGDEGYTRTKMSAGIRYIAFSIVAFRFLYNIDKEIGFEIDSTNKAVLKDESINYLSAYYDQIVYMGGMINAGFYIGHELSSSSDSFSNKSASEYGLFTFIDNLKLSYYLRNVSKESDNLVFTQNDSIFELNYTFSF